MFLHRKKAIDQVKEREAGESAERKNAQKTERERKDSGEIHNRCEKNTLFLVEFSAYSINSRVTLCPNG